MYDQNCDSKNEKNDLILLSGKFSNASVLKFSWSSVGKKEDGILVKFYSGT